MGRRVWTTAMMLSLSLSSICYADTTTDLYDKLNVPQDTVLESKEKQLKTLNNQYKEKLDEYTYAVDFNSVLDSLNLDNIEVKIKDLQATLDSTANVISSSGFDMSYNELMSQYDKYFDIEAEIAELQMKVDKYRSREHIEIPNYDFDALANEITSLEADISRLHQTTDIGNVNGLLNFIQATYTVKRAFDGTGTVFKAVPDTGVLSIFSGKVIYSDKDEQTGQTIIIDCGDGIRLRFNDLNARYVQADDVVKQYQKIATTNENLHVELSVNGTYYDIDKLYGGA